MNININNAKRKKLFKINKKIKERKRDNMLAISNLCFNTLLIVLLGIFIIYLLRGEIFGLFLL